MKIGAESGQVNVHSDALPDATWQYAVEHAMQTARIINPIEKIEFLYVKEYN
jgi:alpha-D-ribose 1-methylphosphonate 5-triphosphate synthase subunit PhnG|tara:strand:- start:485 stop:640 length:156 start_codon:yes stop_codon:yes gene_type:complete